MLSSSSSWILLLDQSDYRCCHSFNFAYCMFQLRDFQFGFLIASIISLHFLCLWALVRVNSHSLPILLSKTAEWQWRGNKDSIPPAEVVKWLILGWKKVSRSCTVEHFAALSLTYVGSGLPSMSVAWTFHSPKGKNLSQHCLVLERGDLGSSFLPDFSSGPFTFTIGNQNPYKFLRSWKDIFVPQERKVLKDESY